jgi:GDP-L-fucose synthase
MKYPTVLVYGGTGFLGKHLKEVMPDWIYAGRSYFTERDVRCYWPHSFPELLEEIKPDAVIHLAADVGGIKYNRENKVSIYESNVTLNTNVIKACREQEIDRVLSCLSTCAWPEKVSKYPMIEEDLFEGKPFQGHIGYASSKRMLHSHSMLLNEMGYNYSTFAPSNLYGEYDHFDDENSHFIASLITKVAQCENEGEIKLFGTGNPLRQFLYAKDLANIIPWLLDNHSSTHPLLITPDENLSIDEMAKTLIKVIDKNITIKYNAKYDGQYRKDASNMRFQENYSQKNHKTFKFTPFEEGIKKVYEYYISRRGT